ncbi:MAG TPA: ABC transporter ATP-binding protein [Bryobacteraceae bacterium]|jgi:ABC-2 type transport system ATP-binding protein|nr:ABC transporter ATP-binding protein [Bryobacteraceae bacterium]
MIRCQNLTKTFGSFTAIDDISLDVSGGICALLGPNGAGKSTLVKMLTGLVPPTSGSAEISGLDVQGHNLEVKRVIGVLPESLGVFDSLTIEEHLLLCGPVYGLSAGETRARMEPLLRILGLQNGRKTFLDQCSHGMRKKTSLAMALLHNPRVLFLDEPFEGIDPVSAKAIHDLLTSISQRGITVFLTSHILSIVDRLATNIMMIRAGRIVWTSASPGASRPLEDIYFDLVEAPPSEDLPWLRSTQS